MLAPQGISPEAAAVACRQMNFSGAAAPPTLLSRDVRSIYYSDLKLAWNFSCSGNESSLSACNVTATSNYGSNYPAYLLCVPPGGKFAPCSWRAGSSMLEACAPYIIYRSASGLEC